MVPPPPCGPKWPPSTRRDAAAQAVAHDAPADVGDALRGEPELLEDRAGRRRRAEVVEADDRALVADPALPAERHADLDADALADGAAAAPSRGTPGPGASNVSQQGSDTTRARMPSASSASAAANASCSSEPVAMRISSGSPSPRGVAQDVAAASHALARLLGRAREHRQLLAGQGQRHRAVAPLHGERPGRGRLVGVARSHEPQVRDRAQRGVVLDRLVGRPVLAQADRVVGPDVDDVEPGQRASRTEPRM